MIQATLERLGPQSGSEPLRCQACHDDAAVILIIDSTKQLAHARITRTGRTKVYSYLCDPCWLRLQQAVASL